MLMLTRARLVAALVLRQLLSNASGVGNPSRGLLCWELSAVPPDGCLSELALVVSGPPDTIPTDEFNHLLIGPRRRTIGMFVDEVPSVVRLRMI